MSNFPVAKSSLSRNQIHFIISLTSSKKLHLLTLTFTNYYFYKHPVNFDTIVNLVTNCIKSINENEP